MASAGEEIIDYPTTESSAQCEVKEIEYREDDDEKSRSCVDCIVNPLKNIFPGKKVKQKTGVTQGDVFAISRKNSLSTENYLIPGESALSLNEVHTNTVASSFNDISTVSATNILLKAVNPSVSSQYNSHTIGTSSEEPLPFSEKYRISTEEIQLHSRRSSDGSFSSSSSSYYEVDSASLDNDEISIAHGSHTQKGIQFLYSIFIFKRSKNAVALFSIYLFGFYNELYTRKSARIRFESNDASVNGFKIIKFTRTRKKDIVEVFETPYPYKVQDLIKMFHKQRRPPSSKSDLDLKKKETIARSSYFNSRSTLVTNTGTDRVKTINFSTALTDLQNVRQTTKTHDEEQIPPSVNTISKYEKSVKEVIPSKDLIGSHQNRVSTSKIRTTSSKNRDNFRTTRTKMKNAKVKSNSKYKPPKLNIFTTRDENISNIVDDFIKEDIVRQAVYDCFNNEQKMHFQRPLVPWPSMHPLLPYKVRYLDEQSTDHHAIRTTSSPPDSSEEDIEEIDEPHNTFSH